jgi:hypothetical protein
MKKSFIESYIKTISDKQLLNVLRLVKKMVSYRGLDKEVAS